jgi:hypothetical protein
VAFKRLKSLGGCAALRADDPRLVRTWLLAHLIAAVLIEADVAQDLEAQDLDAQDLDAQDGSGTCGPSPLDPPRSAA